MYSTISVQCSRICKYIHTYIRISFPHFCLARIGYVPNFTRYPFGTDLVVNAYLKHDSQRADPMELVAGESYLIVGAAKEGNGHDYIRVRSVQLKNCSSLFIHDSTL